MTVTILDDAWPIARREHTCDVCHGTIGAGDRYHRQRAVDDAVFTFKAHALCDAAYWVAWRRAGCLYEDETPDWVEDIRPLIAGFLAFATHSEAT